MIWYIPMNQERYRLPAYETDSRIYLWLIRRGHFHILHFQYILSSFSAFASLVLTVPDYWLRFCSNASIYSLFLSLSLRVVMQVYNFPTVIKCYNHIRTLKSEIYKIKRGERGRGEKEKRNLKGLENTYFANLSGLYAVVKLGLLNSSTLV